MLCATAMSISKIKSTAMNKKLLLTILFIPCLLLLNVYKVPAQCNPKDASVISIGTIEKAAVTCVQNGAIAVQNATGGGGNYVYQIIDGPVLRGTQQSNVFNNLMPGKYLVKISGCNGSNFITDTIIIDNYYFEPAMPNIDLLANESFKCNTNTAAISIQVPLYLPNNKYADTQLYKLPFVYQIIEAKDADKGFSGTIARPLQIVMGTNTDNALQLEVYCTLPKIDGLKPGTMYYVQITDKCGVHKTTTITIPNAPTEKITYSFNTKQPYTIEDGDVRLLIAKQHCVQWGELTMYSNKQPLQAINSINSFAPLTVVVKAKADGRVITSRQFSFGKLYLLNNAGALYAKENNNCLFDSIPNEPIIIEITDKCANTTVINVANTIEKVPFNLLAQTNCVNGNASFTISTAGALPSLPLQLKIYNATNTLMVQRLINTSVQTISIATAATDNSNKLITVPSFGKYTIVYEDGCGNVQKLLYDFNNNDTKVVEKPTANFMVFTTANQDAAAFDVVVKNAGNIAIEAVEMVQGPAGLTYPIKCNQLQPVQNVASTKMVQPAAPTFYFNQLPMGNYQAVIKYGCNQFTTINVDVNSKIAILSNAGTGKLSFKVKPNPCSSIGSKVAATVMVENTNPLQEVNDGAKIVVLSAPTSFLQSICINKAEKIPELPLNLGYYTAENYLQNGVDTNTAIAYPFLTFGAITGGQFVFQPGNYTFQLVNSNGNVIYDTKSFVINAAGYQAPNIGLSTGFICDDGTAKIVISPIGGRRNYIYQIKLATDSEDAFTEWQADSVFALPTTTKAGQIFTIKAMDACNNSFTGQVVLNNYTSNLFITTTNDCIGKSTVLKTGYIPGALYTWKKPDETTIVTNTNELAINNLQIEDVGEYSVAINALDNCITKKASIKIGNACNANTINVITNLVAQKAAGNTIHLSWNSATAATLHHFIVEASTDGNQWHKIAQLPANTSKQYMYQDVLSNNILNNGTIMYRVKGVDGKGIATNTLMKKMQLSQQFQVLKVYPAPYTSQINIDFNSESEEKVLVTLTDMNGKEVSRSTMPAVKGFNQYQYMPVLQIEVGNYMLSLVQGANRFVTKVLKVN